ncbi:MAG: protein kinase [Pseudomonadota bacterium]
MKTFFFALRLVFILATGLLVSLVMIPDLRDLVPQELWAQVQDLPNVDLILAWPDQVMWPLIFVGVVVTIDLTLVLTAFMRGPTVKDALDRAPSASKARLLARLGETRAAAAVWAEIGQAPRGAALLRQHGHAIEAGQLLLDHDHVRKAVSLLQTLQPRDAEAAGGLLEKAGRVEEAHEQFRRAGDFYVEHGEAGRAGKCYYRAGMNDLARPFLEQSWEQIFRPDKPHDVASMLLEVGAVHAAGLAFSRAASAIADVDESRKLARRAASLLAKGGDPDAGAVLLERTGQLADAAELYAHAGSIDKAVTLLSSIKASARAGEILLKVGQIDRAIDCYVDAGEVSRAAEIAITSGRARQGAALLERIGNSAAAIQLLEQSGELREAAEMLRSGGDPARAAAMYERGGEYSLAAALYENNGELQRAAALFGKAGERAKAARLYLKVGHLREASAVLGGSVDDDTRPLHAELGARFGELGASGQALEHLMAAVAGTPLSPQNYGVYFHLGRLYEQLGDVTTALALFQQIYGINPYLEGLVGRIQELQANKLQSMQPTSPAHSPPQARPADPRFAETMGGTGPTSGLVAIDTQTGRAPLVDAKERYRIDGELGRGAMGKVLKAFDTVLQRGVALKTLPEVLASDTKAQSAFLAEARAAAALHHPHIVTLFDVGITNGVPYIAMELVEGGDLATFLSSHPQTSLAQRLRLLAEVASALAAAHQRGIVHRDVKPGNILLDVEGHTRLADFGIARARHKQEASTTPVGTPFYMSPEQVRGSSVDLRADIYSLGVVMFQVSSGRLPFEEGDVLQHHIATPAPLLRAVAPGTPEALERLVQSCLQKDPGARPQSASAVRSALEVIAQSLEGTPAA